MTTIGKRVSPTVASLGVGVLLVVVVATALVGPRLHRAFSLLNSGQQIDIGGRELFLRCQGAGGGRPTVILEHGLGSSGIEWETVQAGLADDGAVCFVSRAGMGFSDPIPGDPAMGDAVRTARDAADDLSRVLIAARVSGPYVLVGHSFGGYVVRLFADRHPDDVVGMVLVDSTHEDQVRLLRQRLSPSAWSEVAGLFGSTNAEHMDFEAIRSVVERHPTPRTPGSPAGALV